MRCNIDTLGPILAIVFVVGFPIAMVWVGLIRAALLSTGYAL
jgi:hypothetical protein